MSVIDLVPGDLVVKDPDDRVVVEWDWASLNLPALATITASAWIIEGLSADPESPIDLVSDAPSVLAGNRATQVRLSGGIPGAEYLVTNRITTNEGPSQTKDRSVRVLIESR